MIPQYFSKFRHCLWPLLFFPLYLHAQIEFRTFDAVLRNDNNRPVVGKVALEDLEAQDRFEGTYFKIVEGKSDEAISFSAPFEKLLKAATVYHHLTLARKYFVEELKSDFVSSLPKMIIRIEHTNQFSELGHFAHDNYNPQFNNALTIPSGVGLPHRGVIPWETEIWFRPQKKVHLRDVNVNDTAEKEILSVLSAFRKQIQMQSFQRFLMSSVVALLNEKAPNPLSLENVMRTAGSSLIMELGYQFFDPITKAISRKHYWLDTALVPEIIYHEFAHVALSDQLVLSHSSAIIEGMADYFAGEIANSPKLAMHIKQYNTFNGKNATRKQEYMIQFETTDYANTDFVFGLLWKMQSILGEEKAADFMYDLRKELTTNSTIRRDLVEALLKTCDRKCAMPFNDKLKILMELNLKGL